MSQNKHEMTMTKSSYTDLRPLDPHPDLQKIAKQQSWKVEKIQLAIPILDQDSSTTRPPRNRIALTEKTGLAFWEVPSLSGLFRGHQLPPAIMDNYPAE